MLKCPQDLRYQTLFEFRGIRISEDNEKVRASVPRTAQGKVDTHPNGFSCVGIIEHLPRNFHLDNPTIFHNLCCSLPKPNPFAILRASRSKMCELCAERIYDKEISVGKLVCMKRIKTKRNPVFSPNSRLIFGLARHNSIGHIIVEVKSM